MKRDPPVVLLGAAKRHFTPDEANALLPEMAVRIREVANDVLRARAIAKRLAGSLSRPERQSALERLEALREHAQEALAAIEEAGVEVKGIRPALLDFPALYEGQEVYLCWREGEDRITCWHPMHAGYPGRRPIDFDSPGAWEWVN